MSNTLGNVEVNDPNNLDEVFAAMRDEMLSGEEYPLQPLNAPKSSQSDQEVTNVQHEADSTNDAQGFDFTKIDNVEEIDAAEVEYIDNPSTPTIDENKAKEVGEKFKNFKTE